MSEQHGAPPLPHKLSFRGYLETRALIKKYASVLEATAADFEKDKTKSAHGAIAATVTFLIALRQPRHLLAPLIEAAEIIQREMDVKGIVSKDVAEKVIRSIAVSLQVEGGTSLKDALKNVVGNDPKAARELKDFRKNMLSKDTPKGAKKYFFATMKSDFRDLPPEKAVKKALGACRALRGQKV